MKKSMLPALLVIFMHATLFAISPADANRVSPVRINTAPSIRTDTTAPIRTTLVSPAGSPAPVVSGSVPSVSFTPAVSASPSRPAITLRAYNSTSKSLPNVLLDWELLTNGVVRQKGAIPHLTIASLHSFLIRLPVRMPPGNEETFLHLRYFVSPSSAAHSSPSTLIAEDWLSLRIWGGSNTTVLPAGEMSFTDDDGSFTILSPTLHIRFAKQTGWLQQYEIRGYNLLEDSTDLRPDFQRKDTPEGPWRQVTRNPRLQLFSTSTGSEIVIVRTEYTLPETFCHLHLSYTINATGEMEIGQSIEADSAQQGWPLPRFSMQWTLPSALDSVTAYGRFSKEIDDSATNRPPAEIYHPMIEDGQPTDNSAIRWYKITGPDGRGLQITADSGLLNLSVGPRTGKMAGIPLHIDYPSAVGPGELPYASYRYGFKVSATGPENPPKSATPTKRQP